jgi:hypothetical protein
VQVAKPDHPKFPTTSSKETYELRFVLPAKLSVRIESLECYGLVRERCHFTLHLSEASIRASLNCLLHVKVLGSMRDGMALRNGAPWRGLTRVSDTQHLMLSVK